MTEAIEESIGLGNRDNVETLSEEMVKAELVNGLIKEGIANGAFRLNPHDQGANLRQLEDWKQLIINNGYKLPGQYDAEHAPHLPTPVNK